VVVLLLLLLLLLVVDLVVETSRTPLLWMHTSSNSFDHTDQIALRDDAAGCSHALVGWGGTGVTQLSCKMFGTTVQFLAKFD